MNELGLDISPQFVINKMHARAQRHAGAFS
jgi:hypothetical protein